jgi:uncharacterized membrane protein
VVSEHVMQAMNSDWQQQECQQPLSARVSIHTQVDIRAVASKQTLTPEARTSAAAVKRRPAAAGVDALGSGDGGGGGGGGGESPGGGSCEAGTRRCTAGTRH